MTGPLLIVLFSIFVFGVSVGWYGTRIRRNMADDCPVCARPLSVPAILGELTATEEPNSCVECGVDSFKTMLAQDVDGMWRCPKHYNGPPPN